MSGSTEKLKWCNCCHKKNKYWNLGKKVTKVAQLTAIYNLNLILWDEMTCYRTLIKKNPDYSLEGDLQLYSILTHIIKLQLSN